MISTFNTSIIVIIIFFSAFYQRSSYGMKEEENFFHKDKIYFIDTRSHSSGIKTQVEMSCNKKDISEVVEVMANGSFVPKNQEVRALKERVDFEHEYQKLEIEYKSIIDFIIKKQMDAVELLRNDKEMQSKFINAVGLDSFENYCINQGVSIPTFFDDNISPLKKIGFNRLRPFIGIIVSFNDHELIECAYKIHKNGLKNPLLLHRLFSVFNINKFFIKDIQQHSRTLISQIINNPLEYKHIPKEHIPFYIDVEHAENNVNNQLALLLSNTDFDCNGTIVDVVKDESGGQIEIEIPLFVDLLMNLSSKKDIDSLPIIQKWLKKGMNPNKQALISITSFNVKTTTANGRTAFKVFIDFLKNKSIQCSDPKKVIQLFLYQKADPNLLCFDAIPKNDNKFINESAWQAFIDGLNNDKFSFTDNDRDDLIHLFLNAGADKNILKQAKKKQVMGNITSLVMKCKVNDLKNSLEKDKDFIDGYLFRENLMETVIENYNTAKSPKHRSYSDENGSNDLDAWSYIIQQFLKYQIKPYLFCEGNEFPYEAIMSKNPTSQEIEISNILLNGIVNYFDKTSQIVCWLRCMKEKKWNMPKYLKIMISNLINADVLDLKKQVKNAIKIGWHKQGNGIIRNNLRNNIIMLLDKWGIKNPEKRRAYESK